MILRFLLVLLCFAAPVAQASGPLTLRDGERMAFRVSWGLFHHAGTITIAAEKEELEGLPQTRVTTTTSTRGFIRALYPFDGQVESIFDDTGRMLAAFAATSAGRKRTQASIVFDYQEGAGTYVDALRPERSTALEISTQFPMDLITTLINARDWRMEPGQTRAVTVLFDDEFYDLVVTAEQVETVQTARGRQQALLLVPRMEENPKGLFRRGGSIRIWLAQDETRLPLRFEVSVAVGTATALLTEYHGPAATAAQRANPGL
jgi:hypothetical protein